MYWTAFIKKPLGIIVEDQSGTHVISGIELEGGGTYWNTNVRNKDHEIRVGDEIVAIFSDGDRISLENKTNSEVMSLIADSPGKAINLEFSRAAQTLNNQKPPLKDTSTISTNVEELKNETEISTDLNVYNVFLTKPLGLEIVVGEGKALVVEIHKDKNAAAWNNTPEAKANNGKRQIEPNDQILAYYVEGKRIDISKVSYDEVLKHIKNSPGTVINLELRHPECVDQAPESTMSYLMSMTNTFSETIRSSFKSFEQTPTSTKFFVDLKKPFGLSIGLVGNRVIILKVRDEGSASKWNQEMFATNDEGKYMNMKNQIRKGDQILGIWKNGLLVDMEMTYHSLLKYVKNHESSDPIRMEMCHLPPGILNATKKNCGDECGIRSISWSYSLGIVPPNSDIDVFETTIQRNRQKYEELLKKYPIVTEEDIKNIKESFEKNPLALASNPQWKRYTQDEALLKSLRIDITRTFSELEYFTKEDTQKMLERILYIWTKEQGREDSYQQGMHELLAVIVMVFIKDIQKCVSMKKMNAEKNESQNDEQSQEKKMNETSRLKWFDVPNQKYLEHDVFELFSHLMLILVPYYTGASLVVGAPDAKQPFLYYKVQEIHFVLLRQYDPQLWAHLEEANVLPQLYLIRWLRLLFTREFTIEQSFTIWDAVLKSKGLEMADYFCIAMLTFIRESLLSMNTSHCLTKVFHYPTLENSQVRELIQLTKKLYSGEALALSNTTSQENTMLSGVMNNASSIFNSVQTAFIRDKETPATTDTDTDTATATDTVSAAASAVAASATATFSGWYNQARSSITAFTGEESTSTTSTTNVSTSAVIDNANNSDNTIPTSHLAYPPPNTITDPPSNTTTYPPPNTIATTTTYPPPNTTTIAPAPAAAAAAATATATTTPTAPSIPTTTTTTTTTITTTTTTITTTTTTSSTTTTNTTTTTATTATPTTPTTTTATDTSTTSTTADISPQSAEL